MSEAVTRRNYDTASKSRRRVYEILEQAHPGDQASRGVHALLIVLALASVASVVFESVPVYAARYEFFFQTVEIITVAIFTIEYAARIWVAPLHPHYQRLSNWRARSRYMMSLPRSSIS